MGGTYGLRLLLRLLLLHLVHLGQSRMVLAPNPRLDGLDGGGVRQLGRRDDGAGIAGYVDGSIGQRLAGERDAVTGSCLAGVHRADECVCAGALGGVCVGVSAWKAR